MSMSKIILTGGTALGVGALGAVALAGNGTPAPVASPVAAGTAAPAAGTTPNEVRTETVTHVIHRVRHEHARIRPVAAPAAAAPMPQAAPARAVALPAAAAPVPAPA